MSTKKSLDSIESYVIMNVFFLSRPIWIYLCQTNIEWHMNKVKYVFSQLLDFLDPNDFNYITRKYEGDKYVMRSWLWQPEIPFSATIWISACYKTGIF